MVLARWSQKVLTRAVVGDDLPDPGALVSKARNTLQRHRTGQIGNRPTDILKRAVTEEAIEQTEKLIRSSAAGDRFINATRAALHGPRTGPGTVVKRARRFINEVRRT